MKKIKIQGLAHKLNRLVLLSAVATAALVGTRASAQIVTNGNFQDDDSSFSSYAGYAAPDYGGPAFPDFTKTGVGGINGYDIIFDRNPSDSMEQEKQFAPGGYQITATGTATNPRDFAFLETPGATLTQNLPNLNRLSVYQVSFVAGTRNGDPDATGSVTVSGGGITPGTIATSGSPFTPYSFTFDTGLSLNGYVLTLENTSDVLKMDGTMDTDQTVDFSNIVITRVGNYDGLVIPEPSTYALLGLGSLGLLLAARRRTLIG